MNVETVMKLISENPITAGVIGTVLATVAAFFRPIMRALQAALIRRIDRAWPDNGGHEERVRKTVEVVKSQTLLPRGIVEREVRKHKSTPPPSGDGE